MFVCIFWSADRNNNNSGFDKDHNSHWGRLHKVEDVKIEWHGRLRSHPRDRDKGLNLLQSHRMKRSLSYLRFSRTSYPLPWIRLRPFYPRPVPGMVLLVTTSVGTFA